MLNAKAICWAIRGQPQLGLRCFISTILDEYNGGCLRAELRERKENSPEALSNFRAVVFSGSELRLRVASPIAESKPRSFSSGSARWTRIEFHLSECLSK